MQKDFILRQEPKLSITSVADFLGISAQGVHHQLKSKNIDLPRIGNKGYINHTIAKNLFNIKFDKKIIVGQIVKGGTGKTTTIDYLSSCVNSFGAKVLLIDADPQGNLTDLFNIDADKHATLIDVVKNESSLKNAIISINPGLDLIPSRIENVVLDTTIINDRMSVDLFYRNLLEEVQDHYDFIFIDCPPTLGLAVTAASLFADVIIVPLNPDKFSSKGLEILRQELKLLQRNFKKNINFKVYLNKFSSKTILSDKTVMRLLSDHNLSPHVLSTTIQFSQEIPNLSSENKNAFLQLKKSIIRDDFCLLTQELLGFTKNDVTTLKQQKSNLEIPATA
tara:strand:+ start:591 stop:1598 length:1008 start_codon:yes stop_codon:yes gene_type:complete